MEPNDEENKVFNHLIESGALELYGMTEKGELTFRFNLEILEEVMPELYYDMRNDFNNLLEDLNNKGLIEITYDEEFNPKYNISEEAKKIIEESGFELPPPA